MPKPGNQACETCQYFGLEMTPSSSNGACVRFPPGVIVTNSQQTSVARHFPLVPAVISYRHSPAQTSDWHGNGRSRWLIGGVANSKPSPDPRRYETQ